MHPKELSEVKRAQVVALSEAGHSQRVISRQMNISQSTVSLTLSRYRAEGNFKSRKRSGRPPVTSLRSDSRIRRHIVLHPTASYSEIRAELTCLEKVPNVITIQRRLIDKFNLKSYRLALKSRLSPKNVRDRLAFA